MEPEAEDVLVRVTFVATFLAATVFGAVLADTVFFATTGAGTFFAGVADLVTVFVAREVDLATTGVIGVPGCLRINSEIFG